MVDELIDVYDENHFPLGVAMKSKAHAEKLWHETFHCWITMKDTDGDLCVLLQLRSHLKEEYPHFLSTSAAGHLQAGEQIKDGVREVEEELGISVPFEKVTPLLQFRDYKASEFISVYGYHHTGSLTECTLQKSEVDGLFYAKTKDVCALFTGFTRQISMRDYKTNQVYFAGIDNLVDFSGLYYLESMKSLEELFKNKELVKHVNYESAEQFAVLFSQAGIAADEPLSTHENNTLIHIASYNKQLAHLQFLVDSLPLDRKVKALNKPNNHGVTPLHAACLIGPSGTDIAWENPKTDVLDIQHAQEQFDRQCAMMPKVTAYLMASGADSFFEKAQLSETETVSVLEYLDIKTKQIPQIGRGILAQKAFQSTKKMIQNRINVEKSLFKMFGRGSVSRE